MDKSVLATAEKSTLESYLPEKPLYLVNHPGQAKPGVAKLEWLCNVPSWEFITLTTQHYALVTGMRMTYTRVAAGQACLIARHSIMPTR